MLSLPIEREAFKNTKVVETGLSDHHKMTITVLKKFFPKQKPTIVKYRNYKRFDLTIFCSELSVKLNTVHCKDRNYESFEKIFVELLNNHVPMKKKMLGRIMHRS